MSLKDVYIVSAARTPIGSFNGALSSLPAAELGSVVIKEVCARANVDPKDVNEVVMGQALTAGQGQNPGRQATLKAGLPIDCPGYVLNILCGSGLKSVENSFYKIRAGGADIMVCGGQESMSKAPHVMHLRNGTKMGNSSMVDSMIHDGLTDAFTNIHMGETAENLAKEYNVSREEQDAYAARSQNLAEQAQKSGAFDEEIVSVSVPSRKETVVVSKDEYLKHGTTVEGLSKLRACFIKDGTVTPGNASGINDSAAAVLLMSQDEVQKRGVQPLARIVAFANAGCEPKVMGIGPVKAVQKVLQLAGWTMDDVDLFELNEAFAAQSLAVVKALGCNPEKVNVNGGAIALGHPIGASGCRVLVTLLYAMKQRGAKKGVASLCIGGGMGIAIAVERV
ncbi:acetyl-CoA acetyltransferase [Culicoides brevitarsis]|uniref:acetyl-CoA acetyltransferase n=1 Tax=Culicoides brevitarsis TaxID=469753 RepID=UPI00307C6CC4